MDSRARVSNFIARSGAAETLAPFSDQIERFVIDYTKDVLELVAVDIQNRHAPRFSQSDAAYIVRSFKQV